jgi:hypothetical protein
VCAACAAGDVSAPLATLSEVLEATHGTHEWLGVWCARCGAEIVAAADMRDRQQEE